MLFSSIGKEGFTSLCDSGPHINVFINRETNHNLYRMSSKNLESLESTYVI